MEQPWQNNNIDIKKAELQTYKLEMYFGSLQSYMDEIRKSSRKQVSMLPSNFGVMQASLH